MTKSFFLLFRDAGQFQPRIYKTIRTVRKYIAQNPELKYKEFESQQDAMTWYTHNILRRPLQQVVNQQIIKHQETEEQSKTKIKTDVPTEQNRQAQIPEQPTSPGNIHQRLMNRRGDGPVEGGKATLDKQIGQISEQKQPSQQQKSGPSILRPINTSKLPAFLLEYQTSVMQIPEKAPVKLYTNFWQQQNPGLTWISYMLQFHNHQHLRHHHAGQKYRSQAQLLPILYGLWDAYKNNTGYIKVSVMNKTNLSILNSPSRLYMDTRLNKLLSGIRQLEKGFKTVEYECIPEDARLHDQINMKLINSIKL